MEVRGRTVLVVDDDASIRFLCRVNLELDGWVVRDAATLEDARAALRDGAVALVLLDGTPVVMLTGSVDSATLDGATPDDVIPKPFRLEHLVETIERLAG